MFRPPSRRTRARYYAAHALSRGRTWIARAIVTVLRLVLRVAPVPLILAALATFIVQPSTEPLDRDALMAVAGIVGTVLSLGLTVTLLVAQHTAERHARVIYVEFRHEQAWLRVLALLGIGVVLILAGALARPTLSTGWAALALTAGLGVYAASLLPRLFDSLDPSLLADRLTNRTVQDITNAAKRQPRYGAESAMKPLAVHGLEVASVMAVHGLGNNDKEVVRSGFAGMRRVLVAYVEGSPTRGWDTEVVNLAFQHLGEATNRCVKESPVLILPAALDELTALGVESQRTLEPGGGEIVSGRLNSLLFEVVRGTLVNDQSAGAAIATDGIGKGAIALIQARSPNMVADHIRMLRSIAIGSMQVEKDHVAGQAHLELSRIALGLATMDTDDIMPGSLYEDACEAIQDTVNAFVERASTKGGLANDWAWNPVTMAHVPDTLARVIVAGVAADARTGDDYRSKFGFGARRLVRSLVKLSIEGTGGFSTQSQALQTAYMAVLGCMALPADARTPELVPDMWTMVIGRLLNPGKEVSHEIEMLAGLLLTGAYEATSSLPTRPAMRLGITEALRLTGTIADEWHRRRRARAWLGAGRAALGAGDDELATEIAVAVARDLRELRESLAGHPWRDPDRFHNELLAAGQGLYLPTLPDTHTRPEVVAAFEAMLDKHQGRRPRRRRRSTGPTADGSPNRGRPAAGEGPR